VVIDNRPGGGTSNGVKAAMSAEPDGYTLMVSNSPLFSSRRSSARPSA
jgi:tripartite-type tricarboxylate transporter receptor subunit TctC